MFIVVTVDNESKSVGYSRVTVIPGHTYEQLQKFIGGIFDYREFELNGKLFDVWFDDEFLLHDPVVPTALLPNGDLLCGNLVFAKSDEEGNTVGLTDDEAAMVADWWAHKAFDEAIEYAKKLSH